MESNRLLTKLFLIVFSFFCYIIFAISDEDVICTNVLPIKLLSLSKILGIWYVIGVDPVETPVENCINLKISKINDTTLRFIATEFSVGEGWLSRNKVIARIPNPPYAYFDLRNYDMQIHDYLPYEIIGTDFNSYATFFSCYGDNTSVWILSRQPHPSDEIFARGKEAAARKGLTTNITRIATVCEDWPIV